MNNTMKWTASDTGKVEEIIFALTTIGKEKMISYDKEIEWLKLLKQRIGE